MYFARDVDEGIQRTIRMDEKREEDKKKRARARVCVFISRERERERGMHRARRTGAQASYVSRLRYGIVGRLWGVSDDASRTRT